MEGQEPGDRKPRWHMLTVQVREGAAQSQVMPGEGEIERSKWTQEMSGTRQKRPGDGQSS